jgi:hypothetical protein
MQAVRTFETSINLYTGTKVQKKGQYWNGCLLVWSRSKQSKSGYLSELLFDPEDGGRALLRHVYKLLPEYTVSIPRR